MQAIFLFIPKKTTIKELRQFARSGLGSWFNFGRDAKITNCEILDIHDNSNGTDLSHGLVSFATPEDARQAIEALNGVPFNGKTVEVREYRHRSPSDKRVHRVSGGSQIYRDSRRDGLKVEKRSDKDKPKTRKLRHVSSSKGEPIDPTSRLEDSLERRDDYYYSEDKKR